MSRVLTAAGVLLALVGLAALVEPSLTTPLPTGSGFVFVFGLLLLLGAAGQAQRRSKAEFEYATTPDTERAIELPTPGEDIDEALDGISLVRVDDLKRQRLREAIRSTAVATIQRREGCSKAEAERALTDGTWTGDPYAAAFFTGRVEVANRRQRMRSLVSPTPPFKRRATHAMDEIHRLAASDRTDDADRTVEGDRA